MARTVCTAETRRREPIRKRGCLWLAKGRHPDHLAMAGARLGAGVVVRYAKQIFAGELPFGRVQASGTGLEGVQVPMAAFSRVSRRGRTRNN